MDVLAHGLWTNIMYKVIPDTRNNRKLTYWGIAFGILPDLVAFTPIFIYGIYSSIFLHQRFWSGPPGSETPFYQYAVEAYNYSHSLVIWTAVLFVVWLLMRKFPWIMLGWALHILIDIFSHTDQYFATPFLFPISRFKISLISWGHPVFMAINYSLLIILYAWLIPKLINKKAGN